MGYTIECYYWLGSLIGLVIGWTIGTYLTFKYWARFDNGITGVEDWIDRKRKGYDNNALWSLHNYLITHNYRAINAFLENAIKNADAYPTPAKSITEWKDALRKMKFAFDWTHHVRDEKHDYYFKNWEMRKNEYMECEKKTQEGFKLFGEYFQGLWT